MFYSNKDIYTNIIDIFKCHYNYCSSHCDCDSDLCQTFKENPNDMNKFTFFTYSSPVKTENHYAHLQQP